MTTVPAIYLEDPAPIKAPVSQKLVRQRRFHFCSFGTLAFKVWGVGPLHAGSGEQMLHGSVEIMQGPSDLLAVRWASVRALGCNSVAVWAAAGATGYVVGVVFVA